MDITTFKQHFINNNSTDNFIHYDNEDNYKINILYTESNIDLIDNCDYIIFNTNNIYYSIIGKYILIELDDNLNNIFNIIRN